MTSTIEPQTPLLPGSVAPGRLYTVQAVGVIISAGMRVAERSAGEVDGVGAGGAGLSVRGPGWPGRRCGEGPQERGGGKER